LRGGHPTLSSATTLSQRRDPVERFLAEARGAPITVAAMREERCPFATLNEATVLFVELTTGEQVSLFVKAMRRHGHPDKTRPDREAQVYVRLLQVGDLPVPRFLGTTYDPATQRGELFLEFLPDWDLRYHGLDLWGVAVRDLARLHHWFSEQSMALAACGALQRLDASYFRAWASRAVGAVTARSSALGQLLEEALADYEPVATLLGQQPPTLVHNDLSPKNVIVDRSRSPVRTCFVDWEVAGIGCPLLDLVHLTYGLGADDEHRLWTTYLEALGARSSVPGTVDEQRRLLRACGAHKTLHRLSHVVGWDTSHLTIERWVDEVRTLVPVVRSR
jgi:hypothetical protein